MKFHSLQQFTRYSERKDRNRTNSYELTRMRRAITRLHHPDHDYTIIHVTGTSGKGSTSAMVAAVLRASGYSVGLFVSPHLVTLRERLVVNGRLITERQCLQIINQLWAQLLDLELTFFEWCTIIGLVHFKQQKVDYAVLEVGMGGRLDATNVVTSKVAVVTEIGFDHTAQLGNTLRNIAREKEAIIKPGCIGLTGSRYVKRGRYVDLDSATKIFSTLAGTTFNYKSYKGLKLNLLGKYQVRNAILAIEVAQALHLSRAAIYHGLAHVRQRARFEIISRRPLIIADGAHNPQKMQAFVQAMREVIPLAQFGKRCALVSVKYTKDLTETLRPFVGLLDSIVLTTFAESAKLAVLRTTIRQLQPKLTIQVEPNIQQAYKLFHQQLDKHDLGIITGSLYMIGNLYSVL